MRVLLIEDNPDHAILIADLFSLIVKVELREATELHEGLSLLNSTQFDVVLCDLSLPDSTAEETVKTLRGFQTETPIVILTALDSYELASSLLHDGIQDYIPKDELSPTLLQRVCSHAIKRKQRQIEIQRQNQELQLFCENVTRDLKVPITRILQVSKTLRDRQRDAGSLAENDAELFDSIERSSNASIELIDGLYHYLSIDYQIGDTAKIDTNMLIEEVDAQLKQSTEVNYALTVAESLPSLYGNKELLALMFFNLIENGIKFNRNTPEIKISGVVDADTWSCQISIQDNGIGIDEEYFSEIYKPFLRLQITSEFSGTGLGLSIVKRIVDSHKGTIKVDSNADGGSTFIVSLPTIP